MQRGRLDLFAISSTHITSAGQCDGQKNRSGHLGSHHEDYNQAILPYALVGKALKGRGVGGCTFADPQERADPQLPQNRTIPVSDPNFIPTRLTPVERLLTVTDEFVAPEISAPLKRH